jgi:hypothetical protein
MATLTHHKKAVRALAMGKREFSFVSAAADNMKRWQVLLLLLLMLSAVQVFAECVFAYRCLQPGVPIAVLVQRLVLQ